MTALEKMIDIYCHKKHSGKILCKECKELLDYANLRNEKCRFKYNKGFCSNCKAPCYNPEMRKKIRAVMRFSGPRMIFRTPGLVIRHFILGSKKGKEN